MMTRDAKIGLLVGLAFILIVGILLSEHITAATAPRQASLAVAGDRVRQAVGAPRAPTVAIEPVVVDEDPQPRNAVVTRDQLDAPELPPSARIELGRPRDGLIQVIRVDAPGDPIASAAAVTPMSVPMLAATTTVTPSPVARPLQDAARAAGMELVAVGTNAGMPVGVTRPALPPIAHGSKVREYVAQSGDSLSRMASRLLGANTPANRQAIVALNPSLSKDSSRVLVGAKYLIPADAWEAALGATDEATKPAPLADAPAGPKPQIIVYVVKAGDSLWKIAEREVGSPAAVATIKALNADVLGDGETVKVGMKLKLPKRRAS